MSFFKDEYTLGKSEVKSLTGIAQTIRLDLALSQNPHFNSGTVTGLVADINGKPISDAVVIILDENYEIKSNTITGNRGIYTFPALEPGSEYHAYSHAPGFLLSNGYTFKLEPNKTVEINFTLKSDSDKTWSIITGNIQNERGLPINSATIELFRINETNRKPLSITFSNEVGQFILGELSVGSYLLKVSATGYFTDFFPAEIKSNRSIVISDVVLREDIKASKGVVMGIITDTDDQPLPGADVILYRMGIDQSMTPVAYTKTNHEGIYLFVNVPQGEYSINASRSVIVN